MKAEFSPRAIRDLQEILEHIARDNPQAAVRLIDRLEATCLRLPQSPKVGTRRDDLASGLRALSHGSYVIYFVEQTEEILRIARVMHGARDVKPIDFKPDA
jgi:toxin ParE1/3/4